MNRAADGGRTELVGCPDDLADLHAPAREQRRVDASPVIAASLLVDLGCPPKLAPYDHCDLLIKAPRIDILDQRGDSLVE